MSVFKNRVSLIIDKNYEYYLLMILILNYWDIIFLRCFVFDVYLLLTKYQLNIYIIIFDKDVIDMIMIEEEKNNNKKK